jgi:hypothetical protein
MRLLIAFLAAPMPSALMAAWFSHVNQTYNPVAAFIFFCGVLYALQTVIGIPGRKLLVRINQNRIWAYVLLGFCGVALPFLLLCLYRIPQRGYDFGELSYLTAYAGVLGAGTGLMFWLLARPDKTPQPARPT